MQIQESQDKTRALTDSDSKVNAMTPIYAAKLGLIIQKTSVKVKNIDGSIRKTYSMASASFLL